MKPNDVITKTQLVEAIASDCEVSKALVNKVMDSFFENVATNLSKGKKIALTGFISIATVEKKKKMGFNPQTKQKIKIPAKKVVKAKLGKKWKDVYGKKGK